MNKFMALMLGVALAIPAFAAPTRNASQPDLLLKHARRPKIVRVKHPVKKPILKTAAARKQALPAAQASLMRHDPDYPWVTPS
jgi:hypothetical protein